MPPSRVTGPTPPSTPAAGAMSCSNTSQWLHWCGQRPPSKDIFKLLGKGKWASVLSLGLVTKTCWLGAVGLWDGLLLTVAATRGLPTARLAMPRLPRHTWKRGKKRTRILIRACKCCSCSVHTVMGARCWVCWILARVWMILVKGHDFMTALLAHLDF